MSREDTIQAVADLASGVSEEMLGRYLTFIIEEQLFGVAIADVVQIVGVQEITGVPHFPPYAKGIINLRGTIIPIIDVRLRFNKVEIPYNERTCIIVTNIKDRYIGLAVDNVEEVLSISDEFISPPPKLSDEHVDSFISGVSRIGSKVVLLLDTSKILKKSELESITEDQDATL